MDNNNIQITSSSPIDLVEQYLAERYSFRFNDVAGKIDYAAAKQDITQEVTDYFINSLVREMQKEKIKCNSFMVRNLLNSSYVPRFNPFHDYLNGLPTWDGITDHIGALAKAVKTNNDELFLTCLQKWMTALVGSLLDDQVINHCVLILSGAQGIGKTKFFQTLVPKALKNYHYSGMINPNNKDTLIHLAETFLINMDELESLNRTEIGSLKALITQPKIRMRRPYGYSSENLPHRASFCGSVNNTQFLHDTTGSRRFLCFEASEINYNHGYDIDLVFAQAIALFKGGFQYWFDQEEINEINTNNEQYRIKSLEEEKLMTYFEPCPIETATNSYSTTALLEELALIDGSVTITNKAILSLGRALSANEFVKHKQKQAYVYAVKRKGRVKNMSDDQDNESDPTAIAA